MPYPVPGTRTSIAFGTLGTNATFTAHVRDVNGPTYSRPDIDMSNNSSPTAAAIGNTDAVQLYREWKPGVLDVGELSVDIVYNPDHLPPVREPNEIITITFPPPSPGATAAAFACDGYCKNFDQATPWEGEMTGRMVLKLSGIPTHTASSTGV